MLEVIVVIVILAWVVLFALWLVWEIKKFREQKIRNEIQMAHEVEVAKLHKEYAEIVERIYSNQAKPEGN